jgi:hypothetical protein
VHKLISSRLLGSGFFYASVKDRGVREQFARHVANFLVPFAKKALESLLVQGFCVYSIKPPRAEKTDFGVPFVFLRSSYETVLTVERGEDKLRCRSTQDQKSGKLILFTLDSRYRRYAHVARGGGV